MIEHLQKELEAWKDVARRLGVCMSCATGRYEPCTDCLATGWDYGISPEDRVWEQVERIAKGFRLHASWGPDATADDGLRLGIEHFRAAIIGASRRARSLPPDPDGELLDFGDLELKDNPPLTGEQQVHHSQRLTQS